MRLGKYEAAPDDPQVSRGRHRRWQQLLCSSCILDNLFHHGDAILLLVTDQNDLVGGVGHFVFLTIDLHTWRVLGPSCCTQNISFAMKYRKCLKEYSTTAQCTIGKRNLNQEDELSEENMK